MKKTSISLISAALLILPFLPASVAIAEQTPCTINGTAKSDRINGTSGNDVICGLDGNDIISGLGGNDIIYGGAGNDTLYGQQGNDQLFGEIGNDRLIGDSGQDKLFGDLGNDSADGGNDRDWIEGDQGNDNLNGGNADDVIKGEAGIDSITGSSGDDLIDGGASRDTIRSGFGNDNCSKDKSDVHYDSCRFDTQQPEIGMTTAVVRQYAAGSIATFSWNVSDDSGVDFSWASIGGPPGWVTEWCGFAIQARLLSGDAKNGTYGFDCKIPENAVNESYSLFVSAIDLVGNSVHGFSFAFTIVDGQSDNEAPKLLSISAPASTNVGEEIVVGFKLLDESGVESVSTWLLGPERPFISPLNSAELVDGDKVDGKYEQRFRLNKDAPAGDYEIWISLRDKFGNRSFTNTKQIISVTN